MGDVLLPDCLLPFSVLCFERKASISSQQALTAPSISVPGRMAEMASQISGWDCLCIRPRELGSVENARQLVGGERFPLPIVSGAGSIRRLFPSWTTGSDFDFGFWLGCLRYRRHIIKKRFEPLFHNSNDPLPCDFSRSDILNVRS